LTFSAVALPVSNLENPVGFTIRQVGQSLMYAAGTKGNKLQLVRGQCTAL